MKGICLACLCVFQVVLGMDFTERPVHTAVRIGDEARLNCTIDTPGTFLEWRNPAGRIYDTNNDVITDTSRFDVIRDEAGQYDLHILEVQQEQAVRYTCQMTVDDIVAHAQVVGLEELVCPEEGQVVDEGDLIELQCHVGYHGYKSPTLEWLDENMIGIPGSEIVDAGVVNEHVNLTASALYDEHIFTCHLTFDLDEGETDPAPEYTDMCHTHYLVNHGVTDIMFQPDPDNFEGQIIEIKVGEHINCTASGRPEPDFMWFNEDGDEIGNMYQLQITLDMLGQHTVKCEATNQFRGEDKMATREVTFNAEENEVSTASIVKCSTAVLLFTSLLFV